MATLWVLTPSSLAECSRVFMIPPDCLTVLWILGVTSPALIALCANILRSDAMPLPYTDPSSPPSLRSPPLPASAKLEEIAKAHCQSWRRWWTGWPGSAASPRGWAKTHRQSHCQRAPALGGGHPRRGPASSPSPSLQWRCEGRAVAQAPRASRLPRPRRPRRPAPARRAPVPSLEDSSATEEAPCEKRE